MRGVSKDRVRLAPGSIPAHADPCGDYINIGMASKALQVCHSYATSADCTPCRSEHVTGRGHRPYAFLETLSCCFLSLPLHVLRGHEPLTALAKQEQLKRADLESVVLAGSSLSSVNGALFRQSCVSV